MPTCTDCCRFLDGTRDVCICTKCGQLFHDDCVAKRLSQHPKNRCQGCNSNVTPRDFRLIFLDLPVAEAGVRRQLEAVQKDLLVWTMRRDQDRRQSFDVERVMQKLGVMRERAEDELEKLKADSLELEKKVAALEAEAKKESLI